MIKVSESCFHSVPVSWDNALAFLKFSARKSNASAIFLATSWNISLRAGRENHTQIWGSLSIEYCIHPELFHLFYNFLYVIYLLVLKRRIERKNEKIFFSRFFVFHSLWWKCEVNKKKMNIKESWEREKRRWEKIHGKSRKSLKSQNIIAQMIFSF